MATVDTVFASPHRQRECMPRSYRILDACSGRIIGTIEATCIAEAIRRLRPMLVNNPALVVL